MNRVRDGILLTGIIMLAVAFRVMWLDVVPPGLWQDETLVLEQTAEIIERGVFPLHFYENEPLYGAFALAGCTLDGVTPRGLRLGSAFAGILAVPLLYWFARNLWGRRTALLASFLLAILPWHVVFSRMGFRGITLPLCVLLAAGTFDRAVRQRKRGYYVLTGLALAAGVYSYIPFKVMFLVLALYGASLLLSRRHRHTSPVARGELGWALAGILVCGIGLAPFMVISWRSGSLLHARMGTEHNLASELLFTPEGPLANALKVAGMFIYRGDPVPRHNTPGAAQTPRILFPFLLLGLACALRRWHRPRNVLLLAMLALLLLPSVVSVSAPHALRTLGAVVPVCILVSSGMLHAWHWLAVRQWRTAPRKRILRLAAHILLGCLVAVCYWQYFYSYGRNDDVWQHFQTPYVDAARAVMQLPPDAVVMHEPLKYGRISFEFITRSRRDHIRVVRSEADLQRYSGVRPLYMLFLGEDTLGASFMRLYPQARVHHHYSLPSGRVVGALFVIP